MVDATIKRVSFAAGEVSPFLQFRDDLAKNQIAAAYIQNFYVTLEGALARTPGTRFVWPYKSELQDMVFMPFRYSGADAYMFAINGGVLRIFKDGGVLETSPGVIYELPVPYAAADLVNLRWQQDPDNNRVFLFCAGFQTRVLTRFGHTNWTLTLYQPVGGPVDPQNLDTARTIQSSAVEGAVTLTGVGGMFSAGDIGGVYRLDDASLALTETWQPDETLNSPETAIATAAGTAPPIFGNMTANAGLVAAFNGAILLQAQVLCACRVAVNDGYVGYDFGGTPQKISRTLVTGSNDKGFVERGVGTTLRLMAKNGAAPANGDDGTMLARLDFVNTLDEQAGHYLYSTDNVTAWRYVWVTLAHSFTPTTLSIAEVQFFKWTSATPKFQRRYNGRTYLALNDGNTQQEPPTHEEGDAKAGDIVWRFLHNGYGFVRIDSFTDANHTAGTTLSRLPDSVVTTPTYRWWPPAWSDKQGWPERGILHDGRLVFARKNTFWFTRPSDLFSMEVLPPVNAVPDPDSGLSFRLKSRGQGLPWIEWMYSASVLLFGLRDDELIIRAPQQFDAITEDKMRPVPATAEGSAPHRPAGVDEGIFFIGRSRRRLHFAKFENLPAAIAIEEVPITNRRLLNAGATDLAWQRDPNRILWIRDGLGMLLGITFMPAQQVMAPFRRFTAQSSYLEMISAIPTSDEGASEVYFGVRHSILNASRRYIEQMRPYFVPFNVATPTAEGAWFVDCALQYVGAPATIITGLDHLEGRIVRVFADGAEQSQKIVAAGLVELDYPGSNVVIGLDHTALFRSLPFEAEGSGSKGHRKSIHHVLIDVIESAGGRVRIVSYEEDGTVSTGPWDDLLPTGPVDYGAPMKLFTGTLRVPVNSASAIRVAVEIECPHALPFTLAGVSPEIDVRA